MQDFLYIIQLGFSGADVAQAITVSFFVAMLFASKGYNLWRVALIALLVDRIGWPLTVMLFSGTDAGVIAGSFSGLAHSLVDNLGYYVVRYLGLAILVGCFAWGRSRIHDLLGIQKKKKAAA